MLARMGASLAVLFTVRFTTDLNSLTEAVVNSKLYLVLLGYVAPFYYLNT